MTSIRRASVAMLAMFAGLFSGCASTQDNWPRAVDDSVDVSLAARLIVPRALQVVGIDGAEYKLPVLQPDPYELLLNPGEHELRMVYIEGTMKSGSEEDTLISDTMLINVSLLADRVYKVDFNEPRNYAAAKKMADNPSFWIIDPISNRKINSRISVPYKQFSLSDFAASSAKPQPLGSSTMDAESQISNQNALERLQLWWKLADKPQQQLFLDWVSEQP